MTKDVDSAGSDGRHPENENPSSAGEDHRLRFAARYCARGFRLLPTIDKFPPKGFLWGTAASSDLGRVRQFLEAWPECDLAVALSSDVVVVDLDVRDGRDGFEHYLRFSGEHPDLTDTIQAITRSGGRHVWFDANGHRFMNCVGNAAVRRGHPGLEIKSKGGYVVVPPARGRHWIADKRAMLKAPEWLVELFPYHEPPPLAPSRTATAHTPYGLKILDRLCLKVATTAKGAQDDTRVNVAFVIGQFVGGGEIERHDGLARLIDAARPRQPERIATRCARKSTCATGSSSARRSRARGRPSGAISRTNWTRW
jgi:hypothetical protein